MKTKQLIATTIRMMIVASLTFFTGCSKTPKASYVTSKTSYQQGETITFVNTSEDAYAYRWTMPDGQISTAENLEVQLSSGTPTGGYTVVLEAFNKSGKKSSTYTNTVQVVAGTGNVVFWQRTGGGFGTTDVTVDGIYNGQIQVDLNSAPDCNTSGCAIFRGLKAGVHSFTATDGTDSWNGTFTITTNYCLPFELN